MFIGPIFTITLEPFVTRTVNESDSAAVENSLPIQVPGSATWETLRHSRNEAAIITLTNGLKSSIPAIRHQSLKALMGRKDPSARKAVIAHWEQFDEQDLEFLRSQEDQFGSMCRSMLSGGTLAEKRAALVAIADLDLNDLIDVLLKIVIDRRHPLSAQATDCLLDMCQRWGSRARTQRDVPSQRGPMLESLHAQIALYHEHQNPRILDAWLRLAHWDDSAQRGLITDPRLDAYHVTMQHLAESTDEAVLQLLGGYLGRNTTPKRVLDILSQREEPELALQIAKLLDDHTLPNAIRHLKKLPALACLATWQDHVQQSNFELDKRLWLLTSASSDDAQLVLEGALKLSRYGTSDARSVAADILRNCRCSDLETLVPALQSAMIGSGEAAALGQQVLEITDWLESPSITLKKAAERFLKEFTLNNLLEQIRHWPTQMCKAMAQIVRLVDPDLADPLSRLLQSPAPKRRLAALQATQLLECADQVIDALIPLLDDDRLEVRVRVIDLLSALGYEPLEELLPELLNDASTDIQDAANRAERRFRRQRQTSSSS